MRISLNIRIHIHIHGDIHISAFSLRRGKEKLSIHGFSNQSLSGFGHHGIWKQGTL